MSDRWAYRKSTKGTEFDETVTLYRKIKRAIEADWLTQHEIAGEFGVHPTTVEAINTLLRTGKVGVLSKKVVAAAFGVK